MSFLVVAQEAPHLTGGDVVGAVSVSVVVGLLITAWVGTKVWGWRWTQIVIGACIGVAGGGGFIGDICRMLTGIGVSVFTSITKGFGG